MDTSSLESLPLEILVVESNPAEARLIAEAFRDAGLLNKIQRVHDGEQAMALLRKEVPFRDAKEPDLILLDLNLPGKNGLEILEEIRASATFDCIPVIILSGSANPTDIQKAYRLRANCYIRKPSSLDEFLSLIQNCYQFWGKSVCLPPKSDGA